MSKITGRMVDKGVDKGVERVYCGGMKYDTVRKAERNKAVYEYWLGHRHLSLNEIGIIFGVSGSRIHYIVRRERERESMVNGKY